MLATRSESSVPALDLASFVMKARSLWESSGGDPARLAFFSRVLGALTELPLPDEVLYTGLAASTNQELLTTWLRAGGGTQGVSKAAEAPEEDLAHLLAAGRVAAQAWMSGEHLSSEDVAERLGITRQAVNVRRQEHKLLAVPEGRSYRYPAWQFTNGGVVGGLERVLQELGDTPPIMVVQFLRSPSSGLDERSPLDVLLGAQSLRAREQADALDTVLRAARLFGEQSGG